MAWVKIEKLWFQAQVLPDVHRGYEQLIFNFYHQHSKQASDVGGLATRMTGGLPGDPRMIFLRTLMQGVTCDLRQRLADYCDPRSSEICWYCAGCLGVCREVCSDVKIFDSADSAVTSPTPLLIANRPGTVQRDYQSFYTDPVRLVTVRVMPSACWSGFDCGVMGLYSAADDLVVWAVFDCGVCAEEQFLPVTFVWCPDSLCSLRDCALQGK